MKLLVIGNCQARVLSHIMARRWALEPLQPIVQFRSRPEDRDEEDRRCSEADVILVQLTARTFPHAHLRSSAVVRRYPGKAAVWPNLFYSGQQPFLRYLTHRTAGRISGPLDVYHDLRIFRDWRAERLGVSSTEPDDGEFARAVHEVSLAALRDREALCDAGVSDLIADGYLRRRLFFTFNHPTIWLMEQLATRLAEHLGLGPPAGSAMAGEMLDAIVAPSAAFEGSNDMTCRGVETELVSDGVVRSGARREFSPQSLRAASFDCYDHVARTHDLSGVRLTPNYGLDAPYVAG